MAKSKSSTPVVYLLKTIFVLNKHLKIYKLTFGVEVGVEISNIEEKNKREVGSRLGNKPHGQIEAHARKVEFKPEFRPLVESGGGPFKPNWPTSNILCQPFWAHFDPCLCGGVLDCIIQLCRPKISPLQPLN